MKGRSLRNSVSQWTASFPEPAEPHLSAKTAKYISKLFQNLEPVAPSAYDLSVLHQHAMEAFRNQSIMDIRPKELRQLPWVLFYPPNPKSARKDWLGGQSAILREYLPWIESRHRTRPLLALLHEFLRVYPSDLLTFSTLQDFLRRSLSKQYSRLPASARKWAQRCSDFKILDADDGLGFVQSYITAAKSCDEYLDDAGFDAGLSRCQFLRSGILASLSEHQQQLSAGRCNLNRLRRLISLIEIGNGLRFDGQKTREKIAIYLLNPLSKRTPSSEIMNELQSFFDRHYGDPRLPTGKSKWFGIPDETRQVMIQWLAKRDLDRFLLLIRETAHDRHWRYREAFWRAFLSENWIRGAWVVLGRNADRLLKNVDQNTHHVKPAGHLRGALSSQSVLLMSMPGVVIAEWSHNGSCHMWLDHSPDTPALYEQEYHASRLRRPFPYPVQDSANSQVHHGSTSGRWQDAIADWLREKANIRVNRSLYFPRRLRAVEAVRY